MFLGTGNYVYRIDGSAISTTAYIPEKVGTTAYSSTETIFPHNYVDTEGSFDSYWWSFDLNTNARALSSTHQYYSQNFRTWSDIRGYDLASSSYSGLSDEIYSVTTRNGSILNKDSKICLKDTFVTSYNGAPATAHVTSVQYAMNIKTVQNQLDFNFNVYPKNPFYYVGSYNQFLQIGDIKVGEAKNLNYEFSADNPHHYHTDIHGFMVSNEADQLAYNQFSATYPPSSNDTGWHASSVAESGTGLILTASSNIVKPIIYDVNFNYTPNTAVTPNDTSVSNTVTASTRFDYYDYTLSSYDSARFQTTVSATAYVAIYQ